MAERTQRKEFLKLLGVAAAFSVLEHLKLTTVYAEQEINCPIYMFHEVGPGAVESVLASNIQAGRIPITVEDLTRILMGEMGVPEKPPFCLTFDDALKSQFDFALPDLKKWQAPATFCVMSQVWRGDGVHRYMNWDQIRELSVSGMEIASHTDNHDPNLIGLRGRNYGAYLQEVVGSKARIEAGIQKPVIVFCSPASVYDRVLIDDVMKAEYLGALSTAPDQKNVPIHRTSLDRYQLMRQGLS